MYGPDEEKVDVKVNRSSLSGWCAPDLLCLIQMQTCIHGSGCEHVLKEWPLHVKVRSLREMLWSRCEVRRRQGVSEFFALQYELQEPKDEVPKQRSLSNW